VAAPPPGCAPRQHRTSRANRARSWASAMHGMRRCACITPAPRADTAHATKYTVAAGSATPAPVRPPWNRTHKSTDGGDFTAAPSAQPAVPTRPRTHHDHIVAARRPSSAPVLLVPWVFPTDDPVQTRLAAHAPGPLLAPPDGAGGGMGTAAGAVRQRARRPRRAAPRLASTDTLRGRSPAAAWLTLPICTPPAADPPAIQRLLAPQDRRRNSRLRPTPAHTCTQAPAAGAPAASRAAQHALRAASRCPQGTVRELMPARPTRAAKTRQQEL